MAAPGDDRRRGLRRMKAMATGLLVAVTVLFGITRWLEPRHAWVGYVRAFAEAAMVGALADWFAVTALFRHPMGLPIPHTAIIPRRKDQIGHALGEFVQENFLVPEVLEARLANAHVGRRLGDWLGDEENAARASQMVADVLASGLEALDDGDVSRTVEALVERRIRAVAVAPLVGRAIDIAIDGGHHERLLDAVIVGLDGFLGDNRVALRARLDAESPWWIPESIDDRIFDKIYSGVGRFLADLRANPRHEVRRSISARVAALAERLRDDPDLIARGEELKDEVLSHPAVRGWLRSLWGEMKAASLAAAADPASDLRQQIDASIGRLGQRLRDDTELQAKIDGWVQRLVRDIAERYRSEVSNLIATTVASWDARATADRIEVQVGRDLQFIRINGTVVGGLAGLVIYTVSQWWF